MRACARGRLACYTQEEVGEAVGLFQQDVAKAVEAQKMEDLPKSVKLLATYTDAEWKPPLYDIWSWGKRGDQSEVARATHPETKHGAVGRGGKRVHDAHSFSAGEVCETEDLPKSTKPSPHARAGGRSARRWGCRREPLPTMCQF